MTCLTGHKRISVYYILELGQRVYWLQILLYFRRKKIRKLNTYIWCLFYFGLFKHLKHYSNVIGPSTLASLWKRCRSTTFSVIDCKHLSPAHQHNHGCPYEQRGTCPGAPWKCCKVFYALAVRVRRSVDQIIYAFFQEFFVSTPFLMCGEIWVGVVHLVVLACVLEMATKKIVKFFEEKKLASPRKKSRLRL